MKTSSYLLTLPLIILSITLFLAACAGPPEIRAHQIAFESYRDGNAEVYLIDIDGENPVRLTADPAYDGIPSWSPDGQNLVFTSERNGNADIYVMDAKGGEITQLTEGDGAFNVFPAWSPDGSQIVFVSNRTYYMQQEGGRLEVPSNPKLWLMEADGSAPERLTSALGFDIYPSWAPDGKSVTFMSQRDGNAEIYRVRTDRFEENLTQHPAQDMNPAYSPDGSKIAFMSDREDNMDIYILDLEDGSITNVTNHPAGDGDPTWSPDGTQLAFISDRDGNTEIYVMDVDGSNVRRVTHDPADDIQPQWRPRISR